MVFPGHALLEPIKDLDNQPFKRKTETGEEDITVKYALRFALTASTQDPNRAATPEEDMKKFEMYELTRKIYNHPADKNIELSAKEISIIQEKARKVWGVEIYGFLHEFLEGKLTTPLLEPVA
jgi:hypothetical protein